MIMRPRASILLLLTVCLCLQAGPVAAQPDSGADPEAEISLQVSIPAARDSLLQEIRSYSLLIKSMRDSLALEDLGVELDEAQKERLRQSIDRISTVVENISGELGRLDLQIKDNRISLLNDAGEGVVINIPENLDEHISKGLNTLSQVILSELPDSLHRNKAWTWTGLAGVKQPPRKVINGNVVKIGDDALIAANEEVRGDVVVILGNAEIAGHVLGDVVVVMGDLQVGQDAEIEGETVTIGGSLDQDPAADVGKVTVIDPLPGGRLDMGGVLGSGWLTFFFFQGLFLVVLFLACLAVALTPQTRFGAITGSLRREPLPAMGIGVLVSLAGHLILGLLGVILILTVIGMPLALLLWLAVGLVSILAVAVAAAVVGQTLCGNLGRPCPPALLAVFLGMCVIHAPEFLGALLAAVLGSSLPLVVLGSLGLLVKILAYFLGLGALLRSRLGSLTGENSSAL